MQILMEDVCQRLIADLAKEADHDEAIELKDKFGKVSMDTIASCVFGVETKSFEDPDSEFVEHAKLAFNFGWKQVSKFFLAIMGAGPLMRSVSHKKFANERNSSCSVDGLAFRWLIRK